MVPVPPCTCTQWSSPKPTFSVGSSKRDGTSNGRTLASNDSSATRADRFAERTDANVAIARTRVPPAVASDEMVTQSAATGSPYCGHHGSDVERHHQSRDGPRNGGSQAPVA